MAKEFNEHESLGEYLRQHRKARGLSLEEIAEKTKVSLRALRALEAEEWELLPAEIYIRGFIRCYCEAIGLDPSEPLLRFERLYAAHRPREAFLSNKKPLTPKKHFPFVWVGILVVILILLVGGYYLFYHPSVTERSSRVVLPPKNTPLKSQRVNQPSAKPPQEAPEGKGLPEHSSSLVLPGAGPKGEGTKEEKQPSITPGAPAPTVDKKASSTPPKPKDEAVSSKPKKKAKPSTSESKAQTKAPQAASPSTSKPKQASSAPKGSPNKAQEHSATKDETKKSLPKEKKTPSQKPSQGANRPEKSSKQALTSSNAEEKDLRREPAPQPGPILRKVPKEEKLPPAKPPSNKLENPEAPGTDIH